MEPVRSKAVTSAASRPNGGTSSRASLRSPGVKGAALLSCVDTEYYFNNWPLQAAILLDARAPGRAPGPLPAASPVPGHPGLVNIALGPFLGEITARRLTNAWLLVQGARDLQQRIQVLNALTVAKIKLGRRNG